MSLHRVKLAGDKRRRAAVDESLLAKSRAGEIGLLAAIGIGDADVEGLRQQGRAFCLAGRFAEALDVLSAVAWLGEPDRHDPLYLGFCHEGLGDLEKAAHCFALARLFNDAIEARLAGAPQ